jgi:hypothetical protein
MIKSIPKQRLIDCGSLRYTNSIGLDQIGFVFDLSCLSEPLNLQCSSVWSFTLLTLQCNYMRWWLLWGIIIVLLRESGGGVSVFVTVTLLFVFYRLFLCVCVTVCSFVCFESACNPGCLYWFEWFYFVYFDWSWVCFTIII